jgi:polar amino acid transport system substrate-binding protein
MLLCITIICALFVAFSGCTSPSPTATATPTPAASVKPAANFTTLTPGMLSIATDASYAPFENMNTSTNKVEGFDIDLMDQIAKELGMNVTYANQPFDGIILSIQTGKYDASISAFTITAERQKTIDFSDPYYENRGQALAVKAGKDNIKSLNDLKNMTVGVQSGTVAQTGIANYTTEGKVKAYTLMPDAMMALKKGEVEAAAGDYSVMKPYVDQYPGDYQFSNTTISGTEYFGIVVSKDNPGLTAAINSALAKIKADGRYDAMYKKWFP